MTKSRKYLNNLPNVEIIRSLATDILDNELKLDKAVQSKEKTKKEILKLETDLVSLGKLTNRKDSENINEQLEELSSVLSTETMEIKELKNHIIDLKSVVDREIREGLSQLYKNAEYQLDEAQQKIVEHQKLVDMAQKNLTNASTDEIEKYRHELVLNVQKMIEDQEKAAKWENQIEAIKRVYKREFG